MNIHTFLLLSRLRAFAGGDAAVLMGDFNFKPGESPYVLATSGGGLDEAAAVNAEELRGLKERLPKQRPFEGGLRSAYREFHSQEPLFTNFAQSSGQDMPFVETLDYIWYTPGKAQVVDCPKLPRTKEEVQGPFPNVEEPSDHLPIRATLRIGAAAAPASRL